MFLAWSCHQLFIISWTTIKHETNNYKKLNIKTSGMMDCLTELKNNSHWIWAQEPECSASCWYRIRFPPCGPLYSTRRTVWEERGRYRSFYCTFYTFIYFYLFPLPCQSLSTAVRYHRSPFETLFIPAFFSSSHPQNMHTTPTNTQQQVCSFPPCAHIVALVSVLYLAAVKQLPFAAPNVEKVTKRGTIHAMG